MPTIRSSSDLRYSYNEISAFCHEHSEPIFITKKGKGDLVVLSIEAYERLCGKRELSRLIDEGFEDEKAGRVNSFCEAMIEIREDVKK